MKTALLLLVFASFITASAQARTWTSADGSKSFEGELKSYDPASGVVKVLVSGREVEFAKDKLSTADIAYLEESAATTVPTASASSSGSAPSSPVMAEKLAKVKLQRIDGKRFKRVEMEKTPEFYVLYFSASWCPPCRAGAPGLVEKFKASIADNPKVEFIHVSRDSSEDAAENWAAEVGFPWLTVAPRDVDRSKLLDFRTANSVPHYVMVDSAGEMVANSSAEVFRKIEEVSSGAE